MGDAGQTDATGRESTRDSQLPDDNTEATVLNTVVVHFAVGLRQTDSARRPPAASKGRDPLPAAAVATATCGTGGREFEAVASIPRSGISPP